MQEATVLNNRLEIRQILQDMTVTVHQEIFDGKDLSEWSAASGLYWTDFCSSIHAPHLSNPHIPTQNPNMRDVSFCAVPLPPRLL